MRLYVLWNREIRGEINRAFYQRIRYFAMRDSVVLLVNKHAVIDPFLAQHLTVVRCPITIVVPERKKHSLLRLLRPPLNLLNFLLFSVWVLWKLGVSSRQVDDDAIVYTFQTSEIGIGHLLQRLGYRLVVDVVDSPAHVIEMTAHRPLLQAVIRWTRHRILRVSSALRCADLVIVVAWAPDQGLAQEVIDQYGVSPHKLLAVPNGVDLVVTNPAQMQRHRSEEAVIFYNGLISDLKGFDTLVSALERLVEDIPAIHLVVAGRPAREYEAKFQELLRSIPLGRHITYLGWIAHPLCLQQVLDSDVCVFPAPAYITNYRYSLPIKVFEYLALGRPTVVSDLPGLRTVIQHRVNGLLVPPEDPQALADAIKLVLTDHTLRNTLEANARESIMAYHWDAINARVRARVLTLCQPNHKLP